MDHDTTSYEKMRTAMSNDRAVTHGNFIENGQISQTMKSEFRRHMNWELMALNQREALDLIATKISRILSGDFNEPDHWDDISGYALLGRKKL